MCNAGFTSTSIGGCEPVCTIDCFTTLFLEFSGDLANFNPTLKRQFIASLRDSFSPSILIIGILSLDLISTKEAVFFARVSFVAHSHYLKARISFDANRLTATALNVIYIPSQALSSPCAIACGDFSQCNVGKAGSIKCFCLPGYASQNVPRNGKNCIAVNPCNHRYSPCGFHSVCTNDAPGSATCECELGFISTSGLSDGRACVSFKTCNNGNTTSGNGNCGVNSHCFDHANNPALPLGQISCRCFSGYHRPTELQSCQPINPCLFQHNTCGSPQYSVCTFDVSKPGVANCSCKSGSKSVTNDGKNCRPQAWFVNAKP